MGESDLVYHEKSGLTLSFFLINILICRISDHGKAVRI